MKKLKLIKNIMCLMLIFIITISSIDINVYADNLWPTAPEIKAEAAIVVDAESGAVLYEKNADKTMYPASITKIVTAIVAIENTPLTDTVTFSENSINSLPWDAARIGIVPGEEVKFFDCLHALLLRSANEAANAIAEHVSGNNKDFGVLMTEYAKKAGATNTNFTNPSGLHDDNHYTTARDYSKIVRSAIRNDIFNQIWSTSDYRMPATNKRGEYSIWHTHSMLVSTRADYYDKAIGGKTGYTGKAGKTLVTYATDGDLTLLSIVLKSDEDNIYSDTRKLLDYGFANFEKITVTDSTYGSLLNNDSFFSKYSGIFTNNTHILNLVSSDIIIAKNTTLSNYEKSVVYSSDTSKGIIAHINFSHNGLYLGSVPVKLATDDNTTIAPGPSIPVVSDIPDSTNKRLIIDIRYVFAVLIAIALIVLGTIITVKIVKNRRKRRYNYAMSHRRLRKRYKYRK